MLDYHVDNFYRSSFRPVALAPRYCDNSAVAVDYRSHRTVRPRYSTSLSLARKQTRDRARMTAFIRRKTAENLPFNSMETSELIKLGTNNSLYLTSNIVPKETATIATQTSNIVCEASHDGIRDIQEENAKLKKELLETEHIQNEFWRQYSVINDLRSEIGSLKQKNVDLEVAYNKLSKSYIQAADQQTRLESELQNLQAALHDSKSHNFELEKTVANYECQLYELHPYTANFQSTTNIQHPDPNPGTYSQPNRTHNRNHRGGRHRQGRH